VPFYRRLPFSSKQGGREKGGPIVVGARAARPAGDTTRVRRGAWNGRHVRAHTPSTRAVCGLSMHNLGMPSRRGGDPNAEAVGRHAAARAGSLAREPDAARRDATSPSFFVPFSWF
jgi:hypothetical protein